MTNLLHLVVALAEDRGARDSFRADPPADLAELTREDVVAAADVARVQVAPELAARLTRVLDAPATRRDGSAAPLLLALCDAVDQGDGTRTSST